MGAQIQILRDGQQYGPFSINELEEHIAAGSITTEDLAWHEGLDDWKPLREIIDIEVVADVSGGSPPPIPVAQEQSGEPVDQGRRGSGKAIRILVWTITAFAVLILGSISLLGFLLEDREDLVVNQSKDLATNRNLTRAEEEVPIDTQTFEVEGEITEASVLDIIDSYKSNPLAADQKFKGKRLRVTGVLKAVRDNPVSGGYFATIQAPMGQPLISSDAVAFSTKDQRELAELTKGDVVTVVGNSVGLDAMRYPHLESAVVERKATTMEPIPGTVFRGAGDAREHIEADNPVAHRAAQLYVWSTQNPIIRDSFRGLDYERIGEIIILEESEIFHFVRIMFLGMNSAGRIETDYAWVVVKGDGSGGFEEIEEGNWSQLMAVVSHCGPKPDAQLMFQLKRSHGWTREEGWPQ